MVWKLELTGNSKKQLAKLDHSIRKLLAAFFDDLVQLQEPKVKGKALVGNLTGLWRYRVGDFRVICQIRGATITILVLDIGHRKEIYKK